MSHFSVICPEESGHFHPMSSLAKQLVRGGHRVTVFGVVDGAEKVADAGLEFVPIGERQFPRGSRARFAEQLGLLTGAAGLRLTMQEGIHRARMMFDELPTALRKESVDILLADQIYHVGRTVAERIDIPIVTVCNALLFNGETRVPPPVFNLNHYDTWWARCRNWFAWALLQRFAQPLLNALNEQRAAWNLPLHRDFLDAESAQLVISQEPPEFELPRRHLPEQYRLVGPMIDPTARAPVPFPFERLTGQPLVYASLGTLQTRLRYVYRMIADACRDLDVQLVLAAGGTADDLGDDLPRSCVAVPFAPQLELLARASLVVTHAGLNTTLESLAHGIPLVAIPITNDQPGVAARIRWTGTGTVLNVQRLTSTQIRAAIQRTSSAPAFRASAERLQRAIAQTGGAREAVNLIERQVLENTATRPTGDR